MFSLGLLSVQSWLAMSSWTKAAHLSVLALAGFTVYSLCLVFYRLYLHPLRNVPGPKLAAATSWYEFYEDVILDGHYLKEYPRLHAQYGPIVRMSPNRVHVNDVEFYHLVFSTGTKFSKEPALSKVAGDLDALPFVLDPSAHKARRAIISPMFSPASMRQFSPSLLQIIKAALGKVEEAYESGLPLRLNRLESNFSMDIMMKLCFGKDMNCVQGSEETSALVDSLVSLTGNFALVKHFPILGTTLQSFPNPVMARLVPGFVEFRSKCAEWVTEVRQRQQEKGIFCDETGRQTVFDAILEAEPHRTTKSLVDETFSLVIAGTETTVTTITFGVWCILKNPDIQKRLLDELSEVETNEDGLMEYQNLTTLPYLTAVITETLRISSAASGILTRVVPAGGTTYGKHFLPEGTSVSTAQRMIHHNPDLFPEPDVFNPERWLGDDAAAYKKNLVPFSKGPRICPGMNLSYMEAYVFLGNLFRRFDMRLEDAEQDTLRWRDYTTLRLDDDVKILVNGLR
ncbi:calcineurin-dependent [Emericellopsis atlantica]|uniref:Calcineurin-dependent n=1 Tax=Emericellopsis atlantica TaxID=2614577 RepID=A0A9P8CN97_9HYPO|nr:calcineurin-dependent [Emericellopsis atlantica]KAG9253288.1 calcineurin-dependent [Emericellopsis atlantica]